MKNLSNNVLSPALKSLLEELFDFAPASATYSALDKFRDYKKTDNSWLLRCIVIPENQLPLISQEFDFPISVMAGETLPSYKVQARAKFIETSVLLGMNITNRYLYCPVPYYRLDLVDELKRTYCCAKLVIDSDTTGNEQLDILGISDFMRRSAERALPFKISAGDSCETLFGDGSPLSASYANETIQRAINFVMAAAFAWQGEQNIEEILAEKDPTAFSFDNEVKWRDKCLGLKELRKVRRDFIHAIELH